MMQSGTATPVRAFLALGSNIGDKAANLRAAVTAINALPETKVIAKSAIYRTPPWGKTDQDWFANAVISVDTGLAPLALLEACLAIEIRLGRIRRERWGPRVIDIDVLTHGNASLASERLTLPHPAMHERAFVLIPLREIAPELAISNRPIGEIIEGLDSAGIEPMDGL